MHACMCVCMFGGISVDVVIDFLSFLCLTSVRCLLAAFTVQH